MRIKDYLSRSATVGVVVSLPLICGLSNVNVSSGSYVMAMNQSNEINIECEAGQVDAAFLIMQQKQQEAAIEALKEMKVVIPDDIVQITEEVGAEYDICPELLQAIIWQESRCISSVFNSSCKGLMQVNVSVSMNRDNIKELADEQNMDFSAAVFDAAINIETGARLLRVLYDKYGDDPAEILMRYNGDSTNLKNYLNGGEMSNYAAETLEISELLERAHGK